jgi:hypothetical protein
MRIIVENSNYVFRWGLTSWWRCLWVLPVYCTVFFGWTPCSLVYIYRRFRGTCCLHRQGRCVRPRGSGCGLCNEKYLNQQSQWIAGLWVTGHVLTQMIDGLPDSSEVCVWQMGKSYLYVTHLAGSHAVNQFLGFWLSSKHHRCSAEGVPNTPCCCLMDCIILVWP